jgi:hypothetical protein
MRKKLYIVFKNLYDDEVEKIIKNIKDKIKK